MEGMDNLMVMMAPEDYDMDALNAMFSYGDDLVVKRANESDRDTSSATTNDKFDTQSACSSLCVIEVAIEYESSFCAQFGGVTGAQSRVEAIVGFAAQRFQVNGLCTPLAISSLILGFCNPATAIHRNDVTNDDLLGIVRARWNQIRTGVRRDAYRLFSGTNF